MKIETLLTSIFYFIPFKNSQEIIVTDLFYLGNGNYKFNLTLSQLWWEEYIYTARQ